MYIYELNDLMFFVKSLQSPHPYFDIRQFVQFASNNTRSAAAHKLVQSHSHTSLHHHFYFTRIVRLWNYLPVIDMYFSTTREYQEPTSEVPLIQFLNQL